MAGGIGGDSRLDLDELGEVIDAPGGYRLDDDDADGSDTLGDDSRVSLTERLESAGVLPWARRHRVALGSLAAVVVALGVGAVVLTRDRPPPVAAAPGVQLFAVSSDTSGYYPVNSSTTLLSIPYSVVRDPSTATAVVDGVRGPGLRASQALTTPPGYAADVSLVAATLGCDDRSLSPTDTDYALHVTTTDLWGRTIAGWVPPPTSTFDWAQQVASQCWQTLGQQSLTVDRVTATPKPKDSALAVAVRVRNALPAPLTLTVDPFQWDTVSVSAGAPEFAEASTDVDLAFDLQVDDCAAPPRLPQVSIPPPAGGQVYRSGPGFQVSVTPQGGGFGTGIPILFDDRTSARLEQLLGRLCVGVPQVALGRTTARLDDAGDAAGGLATIDVAVDVALPRGVSAVLSLDSTAGDADAAAGRALPEGGGRATLVWGAMCDYAPSPPRLQVESTDTSGRVWRTRLDLPQPILARAVVEGCPGMTLDRLQQEGGWGAVLDAQPEAPAGG